MKFWLFQVFHHSFEHRALFSRYAARFCFAFNHLPRHCMALRCLLSFLWFRGAFKSHVPFYCLRDKLECKLYRTMCLFIVVSAQCTFRCIQPKHALFFFAVAHSIGLNTCNTHSLLCFQNAYNCFCSDLVSQGIETGNADLYCSRRPSIKLTKETSQSRGLRNHLKPQRYRLRQTQNVQIWCICLLYFLGFAVL